MTECSNIPLYRLYTNCITFVLRYTPYNMYRSTVGDSVRICGYGLVPSVYRCSGSLVRGVRELQLTPRQLIFSCFYLHPTPHFPLYHSLSLSHSISLVHSLSKTAVCSRDSYSARKKSIVKLVIV